MNQTVFGTEMVLLTFTLCVIQLLIFFIHLGIVIVLPHKKASWRFLVLVFLFLFYNLCSGLFPDPHININLLVQNVFAFGSGIILATYFFYYLVKELNLQEGKFFNAKYLLIGLLSSFVLGYICTYIISKDFSLSKQIFIGIPVFIGIYFCLKTIYVLIKKRKQVTNNGLPYRQLFIAGYLGITFMATMPIVVAFGDFQTINNGLVNVSFFLILFAYYKLVNFESKLIRTTLSKESPQKNLYKDYNLTPQEIQLSTFLFEGYKYAEIADKMFIETRSATSYGSKLYKKTGTRNKTEFIDKFKNHSKTAI